MAVVAALLALAMGGGNGGLDASPQLFTVDYDLDLRPANVALVVIEATPTASPVAIAPAVAAVQQSTGTVYLPAGLENCPAVIVETFGANAPAACAVAWCESRYSAWAIGDHGASVGLFQLWTGWASWYGVSVDALFDPATNATVARAVLDHRGRWGGAGGWTCADLLGIW